MDLILWRHAEAEDTFPDSARRLTPRGRKQAARVAAWLKARLEGQVTVLSSPAARAKETAEALGGEMRLMRELSVGASPDALLHAAGWPSAEGTVILVGHQPTLGVVGAKVLTGREEHWNLKKGGLWWFRCKGKGPGVEVSLIAAITPDLA